MRIRMSIVIGVAGLTVMLGVALYSYVYMLRPDSVDEGSNHETPTIATSAQIADASGEQKWALPDGYQIHGIPSLLREAQSRGEILSWADNALANCTPRFYSGDDWCVVLYSPYSGRDAYDALLYTQELSNAENTARWKLRLCRAAIVENDLVGGVFLKKDGRTMVLVSLDGSKILSTVLLPEPISSYTRVK